MQNTKIKIKIKTKTKNTIKIQSNHNQINKESKEYKTFSFRKNLKSTLNKKSIPNEKGALLTKKKQTFSQD